MSAVISCPWYSRSGTAIVETSEVFLSWMIDWFMNGGTIRRIACGRMTSRIMCQRRKPSARAASHCPSSIETMPPRKISA